VFVNGLSVGLSIGTAYHLCFMLCTQYLRPTQKQRRQILLTRNDWQL
jgi:hypothetical protein